METKWHAFNVLRMLWKSCHESQSNGNREKTIQRLSIQQTSDYFPEVLPPVMLCRCVGRSSWIKVGRHGHRLVFHVDNIPGHICFWYLKVFRPLPPPNQSRDTVNMNGLAFNIAIHRHAPLSVQAETFLKTKHGVKCQNCFSIVQTCSVSQMYTT